MNYDMLFSPFSIGNLHLKNRIVMGPMGTSLCDDTSTPTQRLVDYYEERAKGGAGLIIVEHAYPQKIGVKSLLSAGLWDDASLPKWKKVVDAVHSHGAKIAIEIGHLGRCTDYPQSVGQASMAPSAVRCPVAQAPSRAISVDEIEQYKSDYIKSVRLALKAGFDAIQLHFANGYFLAEWISGRTNKRTDLYGGTFDNRVRFALELTALVRKEVGPDFPLLARFGSREANGGRGIEESKVFARLLQDAGVDCIDVNAGSPNEYDWEFPSYFKAQGFLIDDVARIKQVVSVPVIGGGRITEPKMAELALESGSMDLVSINRGFIADAYWAEKVKNGKEDQIRRCIGCTCCINEKEKRKGIVCTVNPFVGREGEYKVIPSKTKKKILVVGGGPAGLQAAIVGAARGNEVTLVEKEEQLGGMVRAAGVPPLKWDILSLIPAMAAEAKSLGVEIITGCTVTPEYIKEGKYDLVALATGLESVVPKFEANDHSIQETTAVDVLNGDSWFGERVAIIGGGMVGCECAEFVSEYGREVTIFEMNTKLAQDAYWNIRAELVRNLDRGGVKKSLGAVVKAVADGRIVYVQDGEEKTSEQFDTIIYAVGLRQAANMEKELEALGVPCVTICSHERGAQIQQILVAAVDTMLSDAI